MKELVLKGIDPTEGELNTRNNHYSQDCVGELMSWMAELIQTFDKSMVFGVLGFRFKYMWKGANNSRDRQLSVP